MPRGFDRYDEAWLQGRLWTPSVVRPDLLFWFDPASSPISTASGLVSTEKDKGPQGADATQSTSTYRPTLSPTAALMKGRPSILFAADNWLEVTLASTFTGVKLMAYIICTYNLASTSGYARIVGCSSGSGIPDYNSDSFFDIERENDGSGLLRVNRNSVTTGTIPPQDSPMLVEAVFDGVGETLAINGVDSSYVAQTNAFAFNYIRIGEFTGAPTGNGWGGYINEVIFDGGAQCIQRRAKMQGYIAWNARLPGILPASHPFRNRPPLIGD